MSLEQLKVLSEMEKATVGLFLVIWTLLMIETLDCRPVFQSNATGKE